MPIRKAGMGAGQVHEGNEGGYMNCKQGDLAVIVRDELLVDLGVIVRIVGLASEEGLDWEVICDYKRLTTWDGMAEIAEPVDILDSSLRPIRDSDGEDETLQWAPVPTKETA
jgi:hypothetical protein